MHLGTPLAVPAHVSCSRRRCGCGCGTARVFAPLRLWCRRRDKPCSHNACATADVMTGAMHSRKRRSCSPRMWSSSCMALRRPAARRRARARPRRQRPLPRRRPRCASLLGCAWKGWRGCWLCSAGADGRSHARAKAACAANSAVSGVVRCRVTRVRADALPVCATPAGFGGTHTRTHTRAHTHNRARGDGAGTDCKCSCQILVKCTWFMLSA